MSNSRELFLRLVGDEPAEAMAPLFMEHLLNQGMDHIPELVQTGMKNGQTLKAHIQNVSCFAYQIADIVELMVRLFSTNPLILLSQASSFSPRLVKKSY